MIRLLHFSDLHIGMENYGRIDSSTGVSGRVLDFLECFDDLVDYGLEHDVDLAVFSGDAFKTRDPNPTYQRAFARRIKRLADAGVSVVLLVGNHDMPAMSQKASSLDIFQTLEIPNVIVGNRERLHLIETKRGPVQVITIPYPIRNRLLGHDEYRGLGMEELDRALRGIVIDNIAALKAKLDPTIPSVLVGHFSVSGSVWSSERNVMLGRDVVVPKSVLADPALNYVALGHIHKHQNLTEGEEGVPPVVYAGSVERIDFGEEGQPKGFCWVEIEDGETTWEFIENDARRFVTVSVDVRERSDPTPLVLEEIASNDIHDAIVRLIVQTTPADEAKLRDDEIEAALSTAHYVTSYVKETERPERARLGDASPESMTPVQLLRQYLESTDVSPERIETLLKFAKVIYDPDKA